MKKYYKTNIMISVLSEDYPVSPDIPIEFVIKEITNGDWSGQIEIVDTSELSEDQMAQELISQGSDPEFFGIKIR
jgi:hypothetical protein